MYRLEYEEISGGRRTFVTWFSNFLIKHPCRTHADVMGLDAFLKQNYGCTWSAIPNNHYMEFETEEDAVRFVLEWS